jgi:hypothetical protein
MPAPQATAMSQLARLKFMSFNLKVPQNWRDPQGDPDADHYKNAFADNEKLAAPGMPPLFQPATMNKYHVDSQKMHIAKIGKFIDDVTKAICSGWGEWQMMATMTGLIINGPTVAGGQIVGPELEPLILKSMPMETPNLQKYSKVIASVIGGGWSKFVKTVVSPGLPFFPAYAMCPSPQALPIPNAPLPFAALTQVPVTIAAPLLKMEMIGKLGDPQAPFHKELFESFADAFEKIYNLWKVSCTVTKLMPTVALVPSMALPVPVPGPVVAGQAIMMPGGFA